MRKSSTSLSPAAFAKLGAIMRTAPDFNPAVASAMGAFQKLRHSSLVANHVAALSGLIDIFVVEEPRGRHAAPIGHDEDAEFSAPARRSGNDGGLLVEGSQLIITCANVEPLSASTRRPSRAKRRHVNSWLADSPFRRAVAETCRRPS
jgi:hypothetical protein